MNPTALISILERDATASVHPNNLSDVDAVYAEAVRREADIRHPLTDEPWGVAGSSSAILMGW